MFEQGCHGGLGESYNSLTRSTSHISGSVNGSNPKTVYTYIGMTDPGSNRIQHIYENQAVISAQTPKSMTGFDLQKHEEMQVDT